MEQKYMPEKIEPAWQKKWEEDALFTVTEDRAKEKFYLLEMFPYPSGKIHMGHVRNYSIGDVVSRFLRMCGLNVLHPMGWDAFGMPAENAAISRGVHPAKWTKENIDAMRAQLKRMGFSYDWKREVSTCEPEYYKWEQLVFLKMFEKGLAYKKTSSVNWCASCQTVLANEQVEAGKCWRCHQEVSSRELDQWFFRITAYAEELLAFCEELPGWPERVLTMQKNWIGKSHGVEVDFPLKGRGDAIRVFTTRQDTLFGATFMSLAPEHPLALELAKGTPQYEEVRTFIEKTKKQDKIIRSSEDLEKEGVSIEIIDLRTIRPLDFEAIFTSVKKTNRLVILEESWPFGSIASEITYQIQENVFDYLDAPVQRITTADTPTPYSPVLLEEWLPNANDVVAAVKKVLYK